MFVVQWYFDDTDIPELWEFVTDLDANLLFEVAVSVDVLSNGVKLLSFPMMDAWAWYMGPSETDERIAKMMLRTEDDDE